MSTGADVSKQHATEQSGGGNLVGKAPSGTLHQPPAFMDKSGQSDNQSTSRPAGQS